MFGEIGCFLGIFFLCLTQFLAAEFFWLFTPVHIVGVCYVSFKIVIVVKIIFKSHIYPPFAATECGGKFTS